MIYKVQLRLMDKLKRFCFVLTQCYVDPYLNKSYLLVLIVNSDLLMFLCVTFTFFNLSITHKQVIEYDQTEEIERLLSFSE